LDTLDELDGYFFPSFEVRSFMNQAETTLAKYVMESIILLNLGP
jgi:hypothetical protein